MAPAQWVEMLESEELSDAHRFDFEPESDAIYKACVRNRHARFRAKVVQIDLRGADEGGRH